MTKSSIWPIDRTLSGVTTPGLSWPGSNGNEGILRIRQSFSITGASSSDCLVSYLGLTPLQRCSRCILQSQLTGPYRLSKKSELIHRCRHKNQPLLCFEYEKKIVLMYTHTHTLSLSLSLHIYVCVCVCVCVWLKHLKSVPGYIH